MANTRNIQVSFWTDSKIEEFNLECRYMYLYLLTNPHTNLCGCYNISFSKISEETGFDIETVKKIIEQLETEHEVIKYNGKTKEMLINRWSIYNWTKSATFIKGVCKEIERIKCLEYKHLLVGKIENIQNCKTPKYELNTSTAENIIGYLNQVCNSKFKYQAHAKLINDLLDKGYSEEDFKKVIDTKFNDWNDTEYEQYLRPSTLFGSKFDNYLNQKRKTITRKNPKRSFDRDYDFDELERKMLANNKGGM